jgi:hypothetical protein
MATTPQTRTTASGDPMTVRTEGPPKERAPVSEGALWAGALAGPLAFFLHLQLDYVYVPWTCEQGGRWLLHLVALLAVALTAAGTWLSWRTLDRAGREWPEHQYAGGSVARSRFVAGLGVAMGALFLLVMLAQWIPIWILDPCHRV